MNSDGVIILSRSRPSGDFGNVSLSFGTPLFVRIDDMRVLSDIVICQMSTENNKTRNW